MSQEIPADPTWIVRPREGWWSSRPTGLSSDFAYIEPGKTKKDTRGVDYFVGEQDLMRYLDRIHLSGKCSLVCLQRFVQSNLLCEWLAAVKRQRSAHAQAKSALPSAPSTAPAATTQSAASAGQDPLADHVPAPSAPTQSTVQASVAPAQLADQAPAGAAHTPPAVQAASPRHSAARQSQPRLSTSLGTQAPSASRQPPRRRSKSSSDEGTGGGILDSDGENDNGNYTWDDESPVEDEDPDPDEEGPPPPEPLFDGALLTAVGGVGSIASGVIDAKVLKAMSTDG
ncbi:unnamed protein product [Phytophthora fragariaefolia]|uniref:Unnamed protein product n=1 Tax=Phytophthora fragariaefolia TaxID=1490495 RepID=A0A9W6XYF3_9STRA|nr:unnamed protein product [Phytophthora fragariaefolia]